MLKRPVLNATATDRPVMITGVARKSILPQEVGLKPQVRAPASRPVDSRPKKMIRTPSQTPATLMLSSKSPEIATTTAPTTRPIRMDRREAKTFRVLSRFSKVFTLPILLTSSLGASHIKS